LINSTASSTQLIVILPVCTHVGVAFMLVLPLCLLETHLSNLITTCPI